MMLANPADIREALGFDDMSDIGQAIRGSLNATTAILSARLGSPFEETEVTDRFFVPPGHNPPGTISTEFRLSRGFVKEITAATFSDSWEAIGLRTPDIMPALVMDQHDKVIGRIRDYTTPYSRAYMQVSYTAGFPVSPDDKDMYDPSVVPDWLQEAAKLRALIGLAGSPSFKQAEIVLDTKVMADELSALLVPNLRYIPLGIFPL